MNAIARSIQTSSEFDELKLRLRTTWMTGDYDLFSRYMERGAEQFFQRLGVTSVTRLLDVGCGAGQLALIAARAGAQVVGCDIAANWIEKARARAAAERLEITFDVGDAESLPYGDNQFDVVGSLIGAMFAPRPDQVAAELIRVCRPGGMIAMANWTPGGFVGQMFKAISRHIAPSGMPSPVLWGDEATVRNRLGEGLADLRCAVHVYRFDYPFPPDAVVEFFRSHYGPMSCAFASLDRHRQETLRSELVGLWEIPDAGKLSPDQPQSVSRKSSEAMREIGRIHCPRIRSLANPVAGRCSHRRVTWRGALPHSGQPAVPQGTGRTQG